MPVTEIEKNLKEVRERMARAAERAARDPAEVELVAVTKTLDVPTIREAIQAGHRLFGENRVQEARGKIEALGEEARWHMVGHLQTNKAKEAIRLFELIHSVDSLRLAEELDKRCRQEGTTMDILVQVNISGEQTKHGAEAAEVIDLVEKISALQYLKINGLMSIPSFSPVPDHSRPYFRQLREISRKIADMGIEGVSMEVLSMGMTGDFEVAVEEGATMVRVGTAIFGPRGN